MRSRRPAVLRRLHAVDATRFHQTRSWVVSFSNSRPFGPSRETAAPRRCDVIMKSFYRPAIFEKDYPFEPSGTYRSIDPDPDDPHKSYMDYIETLPLTAGPAIFGMHENANISCAFTEAMGMSQRQMQINFST